MDNNQKKGQAILELAIFGAILIMLLGILLNYGLRYGYQQQTMQFAFRKALQSKASNAPPSHVVVKDRHIPNPSDPFGTGAVTAFSSGASIIRSNKLDETADRDDELPQLWINVEDHPIMNRSTAAFRWEEGPYRNSRKRYEEVYGVGNVWRIKGGNGEDWRTLLVWETGEVLSNAVDVENNEPPFDRYLQWLAEHMPAKHSARPSWPIEEEITVAIIDSSHGEILNYEAAIRQCRLIKEYDACVESCERGATTEAECSDICKQPIGGGKGYEYDGPWYCEGCGVRDDGRYVCPKLSALFENTRFRDMGLQEDYVQQPVITHRLDKTEDSSGITTTDTFDQKTETHRKIFYKPHGVATTKIVEEEVKTGDDRDDAGVQNRKRNWFTPW